MTRHWIGVAAEAHVLRGVAEGFAQLGHGRRSAIAALRRGDGLVYYAPRTTLENGNPVQAFVAIGRILTDAPYEAAQSPGFHPWRHDVAYDRDARQAPIRPLLDQLDLTRDLGPRWGTAVRGSHREISAGDFARIAKAMGAALP